MREPTAGGEFGALASFVPFRVGRVMSRAERVNVAQARRARWPIGATPETSVSDEAPRSAGLANILLAIEQSRGTLYMLDVSRCLLERWDLRNDQLQAQSEETRHLVDQILKS